MKKSISAFTSHPLVSKGLAALRGAASGRERQAIQASIGGRGPEHGIALANEHPVPSISDQPATGDATLKPLGASAAQTTGPDPAAEKKKLYLGLAAVLLMVFCLAAPAKAFEYERIASVFGGYRDMDMDFVGYAHVSHVLCDGEDLVLAYSTNSSGRWETEFIATDVDRNCLGTAIVAQSHTAVHIVYGRKSQQDSDYVFQLVHITNASGEWQSDIIDEAVEANFQEYLGGAGGRFAGRPSLAMDTDGNLHLSYCDDYCLKYARTVRDGWSLATLVRRRWAAQFHALALDSGNRPHICYSQSDEIRHLYKTGVGPWGGVWVSELVDRPIEDDDPYTEESARIEDLDMAIDWRDRIHISYYVAGIGFSGAPVDPRLMYAFKDDSDWSTEILDYGAGRSNKIGVDQAGNAHIAYYEILFRAGGGFEGDIFYLNNKNGYWKETIIDRTLHPEAIAHMGIFLAMDPLCRFHIFYGDVGAFYREDPFDDILDRMEVMHAYQLGMCPLWMRKISTSVMGNGGGY